MPGHYDERSCVEMDLRDGDLFVVGQEQAFIFWSE
jgi:hypothetical protein